jgi:hypothetical protein
MLEMFAKQVWVGVMRRIGMAAVLVALVGSLAWPADQAAAQSASGIKLAQAAPQDVRTPRRVYRRPPRLRVTPYYEQEGVYPHYNPGPDAVRVCNAHYEQEFRPSGTVIVPRVHCYWSNDPRARAVAD